MKKEYDSIKELIADNLDTKEHGPTTKLIHQLKSVRGRGYFTKTEFLRMGMWKSPRPKPRYMSNSEKDIINISKKMLSTKFEKRKIELLTKLNGVDIPVASAILMLLNPERYGVIDIRVWKTLYLYGSVKVKKSGANFNFRNWYSYLMRIRYYAKLFKVKARDIERTIFFYHSEIQEGKLYG
ncbi:MAG: hypothetical protein WBB67_14305 [bacterium]